MPMRARSMRLGGAPTCPGCTPALAAHLAWCHRPQAALGAGLWLWGRQVVLAPMSTSAWQGPGEPRDVFLKVASGPSPEVKAFFVIIYA